MANATDLTIQVQTTRRGRAVNYAEELGLNKANEEAVGANEALGILYHQQTGAEDKVRRIKALIEERTHQLLAEIVASPDAGSVAAQERAHKLAVAADGKIAALAADLLDRQLELASVEAEVKVNERMSRSATARMTQLGGYFSYLAASKEALTAERLIGSLIP